MVKLQGTAPNQVPTNADLGSLAYADHDNVNLTAADLKLKALSKTKSQTAVDVFIYDTSKDSDGGAWRHRTQHTSWYNEGASNTRGSRKEFPAVAVIVAESNKVTIYDGDDPSLPMWMVFNTIGIFGGNSYNSCAAVNGILVCGTDGGWGAPYCNFPADFGYHQWNSAVKTLNGGGIADRHVYTPITEVSDYLVNTTVNDVAMTVLPDAPTDPATGLPVPTIAVATDGGVSVIRDDGTVVDITHTVQTKVGNVVFREADGALGYSIGAAIYNNGRIHYDHDLPMADVAKGAYFSGANSDEYYTAWDGDTSVSGRILPQTVGTSDFNSLADGSVAGPGGINRVDPDPTTPANGMVAYTTSTYNTGWMPGSIKLAALADTTAETLSGSELVTDGTFSDTANWTEGDAGWSVTGGALVGTAVPTNKYVGQSISSLPAGTLLTAVVDVSSYTTGDLKITLRDEQDGTNETVVEFGVDGTGKFAATILTTRTNTWLEILSVGNTTMTIADFSVRLAEPDRSVNGNGLAVYGSITKTAVATGADLVAYSGFNTATNYLEQPYNSGLNFGEAGDFCMMGWVKASPAAKATQDKP